MLRGWLNSWDVLFLSSVRDPLIHACLLSFIHLIQSPASLFSSESRLKDNWCRMCCFPGLCPTNNTLRHQHRSQIILRFWGSQGKDCQDDAEIAFSALLSHLMIKMLLQTFRKVQKSSSYFDIPWRGSARDSRLQIALKSNRSQISSAWLLRKINQCPLWSSRFWWPGHRSVPVRYKHVQIRWRVPTNWKHGDLHLWLQGKFCFAFVLCGFQALFTAINANVTHAQVLMSALITDDFWRRGLQKDCYEMESYLVFTPASMIMWLNRRASSWL